MRISPRGLRYSSLLHSLSSAITLNNGFKRHCDLTDFSFFQPDFSEMRDSELVKLCDRLGVNNRYTGYRHNLNRGNLDPVRIGYAWLNQEPNKPPNPKWTPEPKWTPPNASKCACDPPNRCQEKAEPACRPSKVPPAQDPPYECNPTFRPIPNLVAQCKGETDPNISLPTPIPERPKSQPKCDSQATKSLSVSKCVPVPRTKSAEKISCCTSPNLSPEFVCASGQPEVDLSIYIRKPRRECYIKNRGGRKADLDSFATPQNYFMPQRRICRPGKK